MLELFIIGSFFALGYFLPSVIAFGNKRVAKWGILVVNTFLGWTLIGWVVCLAWSVLPEFGREFQKEFRRQLKKTADDPDLIDSDRNRRIRRLYDEISDN